MRIIFQGLLLLAIAVEYFISPMETELIRNRDILPADALAEFEQALSVYRELLARAR